MLSEFALINKFFVKQEKLQANVICGIGDDAAIVQLSPEHRMVTAMDTLVSGAHFYPDMPADALGYKALAVNLSDLAAMGAVPKWFTLALTMPEVDEDWLKGFSKGLFSCAKKFKVNLIGGDTTKGPLSITIQVLGEIGATAKLLLRSGAQIGDSIYVSGSLGAAAAAVKQLDLRLSAAVNRACLEMLYYPEPQLVLGEALVGRANSAIDISDGLVADLNHILEQSGRLGAELWQDKLPIDLNIPDVFSKQQKLELALYGGEDYQLCFTFPHEFNFTAMEIDKYNLTCIGKIVKQSGVRLVSEYKKEDLSIQGWSHF